MHDVNHALGVLSDMTGLTDLALDRNGQAALTFNGVTQVDISRIDEQSLEFVAELPAHADLSVNTAKKLLEANYLGVTTGAARLALSPSDGKLVLCERVDVGGLDARMLEARLIAFLEHVTFWTGAASGALLQDVEEPAAESQVDYLIRV